MEKRSYKPLTIPRLQWDKQTLSETYGQLVAHPLEPGFGITVGNSLRRVLLAAVEGSAVTSVIIKGVNNEFATLPGVIEDIMQLVLNIKEIVIHNKTGQPGKMSLKITGKDKKEITAADIKADEHLVLVNKKLVLAHLAEDGELDITFFVECGRGYKPAQWPIGSPLQADKRIYVDAMFSPLMKVHFDVEKTRVGKDIDYDKLTLHIHTNGAQKPTDVVHYAVSVLRTQLEHFLLAAEIPFNEISHVVAPQEPQQKNDLSAFKNLPLDLLLKPIDELELSARSHNSLENHGIKRILDLVTLNKEEAAKIKNFGSKSLIEVTKALQELGFSFDMNIKEEDITRFLKHKE